MMKAPWDQWHSMPTPLVAPLGIPVDRAMVQEVWDTFVKPSQADDAGPQSSEMRTLMAVLRAVYQTLPEEEKK